MLTSNFRQEVKPLKSQTNHRLLNVLIENAAKGKAQKKPKGLLRAFPDAVRLTEEHWQANTAFRVVLETHERSPSPYAA
jgi:hypothetical protein